MLTLPFSFLTLILGFSLDFFIIYLSIKWQGFVCYISYTYDLKNKISANCTSIFFLSRLLSIYLSDFISFTIKGYTGLS